jgi:phosphoserine aminotransferase
MLELNMGPAGTTLVIKEEILGKSGRVIPSILDYEKHIKAESMYNTPAVFPVYASINFTMVEESWRSCCYRKIK